MTNNVYVDLPKPDAIGKGTDDTWTNVFTANSKAEAIAWIREHIGPCDDNGNICLLSNVVDPDKFTEEDQKLLDDLGVEERNKTLYQFSGIRGGVEHRVKFSAETEELARKQAVEWYGHDRVELLWGLRLDTRLRMEIAEVSNTLTIGYRVELVEQNGETRTNSSEVADGFLASATGKVKLIRVWDAQGDSLPAGFRIEITGDKSDYDHFEELLGADKLVAFWEPVDQWIDI